MAKAKMICPFSGKLCRECPIYRGRHYLLCFNKDYRGHMKESDKISNEIFDQLGVRKSVEGLFKIKAVDNTKSIDPYTANMPDLT
jgi:hypothetical protein